MPEHGGPATQEGVYYQNTIAARYLADLLDLTPLPPRERVVEVRVEAPSHVDDIVVRFSDGHRDWLQAKSSIHPSGDAWNGLWPSLASQAASPGFTADDRLIIVVGNPDNTARTLRDLCERAVTASDEVEWLDRLRAQHQKLLLSIKRALGSSSVDPLELLRRTTVEITPLQEIERAFERKRLGTAFALPPTLLPVLRDMAGGGARRRALFLAAPLRRRLAAELGIEVTEPVEWGLPAYRSTIQRLARIEIPGTGISGPVSELFVWPRARDYNRSGPGDFEDEDPRWESVIEAPIIDLQGFPSDTLERCIVIAGPGYGKSALLNALAASLVHTPYVPVLVPLASFAASELGVMEFLATEVNREFDIRVDWLRLAEHGLVALLFDGLDEIPPARRQRLLRRTAAFSARHPLVPWLLTVRDPAVLSGPADARMIELLSVDAEDIIRFAEVMRKRIPKLDGWEFTRRLEAYPELARLARIPLFLVMLMALHGSPVMPSSRVDLIETYLKTLFSPHEHKAVASAGVEASNLREAAEALAFDRLERQEIGATEREVQDVVARADVDAGSPEAVLTRLLINGVLRRQSSIRLQFPYPIVQEHLAACYIIRKCPETLVQRIEDAIQRPWAQVIQFALELHPAPTSIIRSMLEREDDAFATRLRLIGRCVANGANIGAELRPEITRRLTNLWVRSSSWHIRERVGRLIVDAFSSPLPSEVRAVLSLPWLTHWGAGEIVTREKDRTLTMEVLSALLGVDGFTTFRTLQPALDAVGDDVFKKYSEKARQPGIGGDELSNLAHLIGALDSNTLTPGIGLDLALDESLPDTLRLAAFSCGAPPLDDRAWPIIRRALNDEYGSWSAIKCIARTSQPDEAVLGLLRDPTLGMGERARLFCSPQALFPKPEARRVFIQRCISEESLPLELRDMMLVFAARYDNREAFQDLVNRLPTLELEIAEATVSLLGHHPLRDLGLGAAKAVASRVSTAEEAVRFAQDAVIGVTSTFEMDSFRSGVVRPSLPHPSLDAWAELVETWTIRYDFTPIQQFKILAAASRLGSLQATNTLEGLVRDLVDPDDSRLDQEDENGHHIRAAMYELQRKRRRLPLAVAERFARASRSNLAYAGVEAIAVHADRAALELLLRLYNGSSDPIFRGSLSDTTETLAGRLGLIIAQVPEGLKVA